MGIIFQNITVFAVMFFLLEKDEKKIWFNINSNTSHPILPRSADLNRSLNQSFRCSFSLNVNSWLFCIFLRNSRRTLAIKYKMSVKMICNLFWAQKSELWEWEMSSRFSVCLYAHVNINETRGEQTGADERRCASVCCVSAWITNSCAMNSLLPLSPLLGFSSDAAKMF